MANAGDVMAQTMRKIGQRVGLMMNTFYTLIFTTLGTLRSGHFTWSGWAIGGVLGFITGAIVTAIIPPKKVQDWTLAKLNLSYSTFKGKLASSIVTSAILFPFMTGVMGVAMPMMSVKGMERGIAATETELVQLQSEQDALKSQQSELQGKYDAILAEIETLEAQADAATSPAEKEPLNGQIEGKKNGAEEMKAGIDEMQSGIDGMQEGINGMTESINARKGAAAGIKASILPSLPLNILLMSIIGITLGMIVQPFFMKIAVKSVLGKDAEMPM